MHKRRFFDKTMWAECNKFAKIRLGVRKVKNSYHAAIYAAISGGTEIKMQGTMTKEAQMLEQLYKNVKMGSDSIVKLLDKVSDSKFKTDLTDQLNGYEGFASKAKARLKEMGAEAKEENVMVKLWSSIGMAMSTLTDSTDSHIAELIAEGSTMGITDGIKLLREYENTNVSESGLKLVRDVIEFEERNLERAKSYI